MSLNRIIFNTIISQLSVQILGIISGIFIARLIGPEGKGVFAIYQANAQLLVTFFSLSIGSVLTYFIPSGKVDPSKMLGISVFITLFGSIGVVLLVLLFNYTILKNYLFPTNYCSVIYIVWLCFFSIFSIINFIINNLFQSLKKFKEANNIAIYNSVINVVFFTTVFFLDYNKIYHVTIIELLLGLLFITIINTAQLGYVFYKCIDIRPSFKISKEDIKQISSYTIYTHLGIFVGFFNQRFSLWILNTYLNETAIGLYSLALNLIVIFNLVSAPVGNVLMPYLSDNKVSNKSEVFYKYSRINFSLLLLMSIIGFFISIPIIPLLYGADFGPSILLFQLMLPGILFACTNRLLSVFIASCNKQDYNLYSVFVGFIINIILSFTLIKNYGMIGASISTTITYVLNFLVMIYFIHVKLKLPFGNYFIIDRKELSGYLKYALNFIIKK